MTNDPSSQAQTVIPVPATVVPIPTNAITTNADEPLTDELGNALVTTEGGPSPA
jgi:hypothetical protein